MNYILDPRTKISLLIFATVYIGLQLSFPLEITLILIYVFPLFMTHLQRVGFVFLSIYILQVLIGHFLLPLITSGFLLFVLSFSTHGLRLLLPSIIAGYYAMKTTKVNEWIAAFKKLHLPNWLLIPLAVMARFFPTIREDYRNIRKAMAFRGISTGFVALVKNPVRTLEFILIPLLMNATQVSEDLTISALTKGLNIPGQHTTIVRLEMKNLDWIFIGLALLPFMFHLGGIYL